MKYMNYSGLRDEVRRAGSNFGLCWGCEGSPTKTKITSGECPVIWESEI